MKSPVPVLASIKASYAKFRKVGFYETFSLNCKNCSKLTNGLKCPACEITKLKTKPEMEKICRN